MEGGRGGVRCNSGIRHWVEATSFFRLERGESVGCQQRPDSPKKKCLLLSRTSLVLQDVNKTGQKMAQLTMQVAETSFASADESGSV